MSEATIEPGSRWVHKEMRCVVLVKDATGDRIVFHGGLFGDTSTPRANFRRDYEPAPDDEAPDATPGHDPVNHPAHYTSHPARCKCGAGIECIQVARHCNFNVGNAIKYLWRHGSKGRPIEDLEKAAWYINDEIERLREAVR